MLCEEKCVGASSPKRLRESTVNRPQALQVLKLKPSTSQRGVRGFERLYVECVHHGHYCTLKRPMSKIWNERFRERALAAATSYASVLAHNNARCIYPPIQASRTRRLSKPRTRPSAIQPCATSPFRDAGMSCDFTTPSQVQQCRAIPDGCEYRASRRYA